ncbi:MAG: hypothetical protein A2163_00815 [Actinobacteria bacterium RBG_13_35_12]|nr:MAG: hypothetical protein A2163_00815 [Actinobacteria bacterium RBG_13_35_12]
MILYCSICGNAVSNDLPNNTIVRAGLVCPECLENGKYNSTVKMIINIGQDAIPSNSKTSGISRQ